MCSFISQKSWPFKSQGGGARVVQTGVKIVYTRKCKNFTRIERVARELHKQCGNLSLTRLVPLLLPWSRGRLGLSHGRGEVVSSIDEIMLWPAVQNLDIFWSAAIRTPRPQPLEGDRRT